MIHCCFAGIDPGLTGAVCVMTPDGGIGFFDTPSNEVIVSKGKRNVYDRAEMLEILRTVKDMFERVGEGILTIEEIHAMPTSGGMGNFSSGFGFGCWLMALDAIRIPYQIVQPRTWKKAMGLKAAPDASDTDKKNADRMLARQLFPQAANQMNLQKHHGRADSLLIAAYGQRLGITTVVPVQVKAVTASLF